MCSSSVSHLPTVELEVDPEELIYSGKVFDCGRGPGRFLLRCSTQSITWNRAGDAKTKYNFSRAQLPILLNSVYTHFATQGLGMPSVKLDLARPPSPMTRDEHWLAVYVMLSRCTELSGILIWRMCARGDFDGGPPKNLQTELDRLSGCEYETLRNLAAYMETVPHTQAAEYAVMLHELADECAQQLKHHSDGAPQFSSTAGDSSSRLMA